MGLPHFNWSLTLLGLCIFTFTIITYWISIGVVGILIGVVGLLVGRDRLRVPLPIWLYGAFLLWAYISSFASPYQDVAIETVMERLKLLVIMLIAVCALRTEGQLRFYLLFYLGCFILFPVRGTFVGGDDYQGRAVWNHIYSNPNDLAALSLIALGFAFGLYKSEPSRTLVRFGAGISVILLLVVILRTESRGAFLGLLVIISVPVATMLVKQRLRTIGSVVAVVFLISHLVPESLWERLSGMQKITNVETIAEADKWGSAGERFEIAKIAWRIFDDHSFFGVGLGAYRLAHVMYAPSMGARDTHNTYLNLAAEVGLPGLLLWCAFIGSVVLYAYRSQRQVGMGMLATQQRWITRGLIGYLVAGIFGSYSHYTSLYLLLAVLWCSATLLRRAIPCTANHAELKRG